MCFFFELALIMSTLNLLMYIFLDLDLAHIWKIDKITANVLGPACLFIEFFLLNTIPFSYNHYVAILPFLSIYLLLTVVVYLFKAEPVYKWFNWEIWSSYIVAPSLILTSWILFILFR